MECYTKEETQSAKKVLDFYIDLIEDGFRKDDHAAAYYLAENVVVDWFGKTVKGNKKAKSFIKEQISKVTHHIKEVRPAENVAFRDTHRVKILRDKNLPLVTSPIHAGGDTLPQQIEASTSVTTEIGQGDGFHNSSSVVSPCKRLKLTSEHSEVQELDRESKAETLKYLTGQGDVEFKRPSIKKLQLENRWRRPVKLHIGYTARSLKDYTIYLIIYEGNLKCRKNLFKEFCESEEEAL